MAICGLLQRECLQNAGSDLHPLFTPHDALIWNNQASIKPVVNHDRDVQVAQKSLEVCGEAEFLVTDHARVEASPPSEAKRLTCCNGYCGLCRLFLGQEWEATLPGLDSQGHIGCLIVVAQLFHPWPIKPPLTRPPARLDQQSEVGCGPASKLVLRHTEDSRNEEFSVSLRSTVQQSFRWLTCVMEEADGTVSFLGVVAGNFLQGCACPATSRKGELYVRSCKPSKQDGAEPKKSPAAEAPDDGLSRSQHLQQLDPAETVSTTRLVSFSCLWPHENATGVFRRVLHHNVFNRALDDVPPPSTVAVGQGTSSLVYSNLPALMGEQVWHELEPFLVALRWNCHGSCDCYDRWNSITIMP
mmetsp:Transcript_62719/g.130123  ORF Transcript_62719/g.130123 Transcript_62719/m.130123 type:complete len:357 (+) Transcript_62719:705-1775(+)